MKFAARHAAERLVALAKAELPEEVQSLAKQLKKKEGLGDMAYSTQYTVEQLCALVGAELPEEYQYLANDLLTNVSYNVHFLQEGGAFFLAAQTDEDRAKKLDKAIEAKVKIVFGGPLCRKLPRMQEVPHVIIKNVFDQVIRISAGIREETGVTVVGITGSLGKTTTKEIVFSVLKQRFETLKCLGNQNTIFPILENLQKMPKTAQVFVQEFGAATPGVMPKTVRACMPNAGIITNISDAHLDAFGSRENLLKEKIQMVTQMPDGCPAFLNYDDELLKTVSFDNRPIISYAVDNKDADYYAENIQLCQDYMTFDIVHGRKRTPVRLNAQGKHNVGNAVAAMAVGKWFGMSEKEIAKGIESYKTAGVIRQNLTSVGGYRLYIDCYNANPTSLMGAVNVLNGLEPDQGGKRVAVIGGLAALGEQSRELHVKVGEEIGGSRVDLALCFGNEDSKAMADTIRAGGTAALYTDNREELNAWMRGLITRKDVTLIKGSNLWLMSKSIDQVFGTTLHAIQGHADTVTTDEYRVKLIEEQTDPEKKTVLLSKYTGADSEVKIPEEYVGGKVFAVGLDCFRSNEQILQVEIPETVSCISRNAFRACKSLREVKLPKSLIRIDARAFRYCSQLKEVVIPDRVIEIGEEAFIHCSALEKVFVPASVGHIGEKAFAKNPKLTIVCSEGSYAESYARKNKLRVELSTV